ncbi:MAG: hypothetical protein RLZZ34_2616, partial [Verrucomicrobiota bacterium]
MKCWVRIEGIADESMTVGTALELQLIRLVESVSLRGPGKAGAGRLTEGRGSSSPCRSE